MDYLNLKEVPQEIIEIISKMLIKEQNKRIKAEDILNTPFFSKFNKDLLKKKNEEYKKKKSFAINKTSDQT